MHPIPYPLTLQQFAPSGLSQKRQSFIRPCRRWQSERTSTGTATGHYRRQSIGGASSRLPPLISAVVGDRKCGDRPRFTATTRASQPHVCLDEYCSISVSALCDRCPDRERTALLCCQVSSCDHGIRNLFVSVRGYYQYWKMRERRGLEKHASLNT